MSKLIINIPDEYPRVEGVVELFGKGLDGVQLPYLNAYLDRNLSPGDVIQVTFRDPFSHIDSVGSIKTAHGEVFPVFNLK